MRNFFEPLNSPNRDLTWSADYEDGVTWRGVHFTTREWEHGTLLAASKIQGRNHWIPDACVLWELVKPRHLPFFYSVLVPVLRQLAALGLICTFRQDTADVPVPTFLSQPAPEQIQ